MICFINRSTVDYDVRLNKYIKACKATNTQYFVIGWDRLLNAKIIDEHEYQMKYYCPYAHGKKIWPMFLWFCFVWFHLIKNYRKYKVIHACNMENTLISLPFKLLGKKIIFDVYDSQYIKLERKLAQHIDCLILPTEQRLEQIGIKKDSIKRFLEIENVPTFNHSLTPKTSIENEFIRLSYVGIFQKRIRGLENLIQMVKDDNRFILNIAGAGDELDNMIKEAANKCSRIIYHGKVQYDKALEIMNTSNYIVALYYPFSSNHVYASPNKFYESLFLRTPIITSLDTLVGNKVTANNTGYVVDDTADGLKKVFEGYGTEEYVKEYAIKCNNCHNIWQKNYIDYKGNVLEGKYIQQIQSLYN